MILGDKTLQCNHPSFAFVHVSAPLEELARMDSRPTVQVHQQRYCIVSWKTLPPRYTCDSVIVTEKQVHNIQYKYLYLYVVRYLVDQLVSLVSK